MSKIIGVEGQVFVCYKDNQPTFNIVTNGSEAAVGGKDDGIFEYRQLSHEDLMNGDILDQVAQKNTLIGWEKFHRTSPDCHTPAPTPAPKPPKDNEPPCSSPAPSPAPRPAPAPSPGPGPAPSSAPAPSNSPAPAKSQLSAEESQSLIDLMGQTGATDFSNEDLKAIENGKFRDITPSEDAVNAARKLTANDNALARELDQKGDNDGLLRGPEINPWRTPSQWTENNSRDMVNLMQKANVDHLTTPDLTEIANGKWSKYNGTLTENEINSAKILRENQNARVRDMDEAGNNDGFLQANDLLPGSQPNKPSRNVDPNNVKGDDIEAIYPHGGPNGKTSYAQVLDDVKRHAGITDESQTHVEEVDVRKAMLMEKDPNKKAILKGIYDQFFEIDRSAHTGNPYLNNWQAEDKRIGAEDLQKYFSGR